MGVEVEPECGDFLIVQDLLQARVCPAVFAR